MLGSSPWQRNGFEGLHWTFWKALVDKMLHSKVGVPILVGFVWLGTANSNNWSRTLDPWNIKYLALRLTMSVNITIYKHRQTPNLTKWSFRITPYHEGVFTRRPAVAPYASVVAFVTHRLLRFQKPLSFTILLDFCASVIRQRRCQVFNGCRSVMTVGMSKEWVPCGHPMCVGWGGNSKLHATFKVSHHHGTTMNTSSKNYSPCV